MDQGVDEVNFEMQRPLYDRLISEVAYCQARMVCMRFDDETFKPTKDKKGLYGYKTFREDFYNFCNELKLWTFKPQFLRSEVPERHLLLWRMEIKMAKKQYFNDTDDEINPLILLLCFPSEENDYYEHYVQQKRSHVNLDKAENKGKKKHKGVSIAKVEEIHVYGDAPVRRTLSPQGSDKDDTKSHDGEKTAEKQEEKSEKGEKKTTKQTNLKAAHNFDAVEYNEDTNEVYERSAGKKSVDACLFCAMMMKLYRLRSQRIVYMSKEQEQRIGYMQMEVKGGELAQLIKKLQHKEWNSKLTHEVLDKIYAKSPAYDPQNKNYQTHKKKPNIEYIRRHTASSL